MASFQRLTVAHLGDVCRVCIVGPNEPGTIDVVLVSELESLLNAPELPFKILVLEGSESIFCAGADFSAIMQEGMPNCRPPLDPERLYRLWLRLAYGPFISVAHVRGRATAGGVGFVAACDIALASTSAEFGLSELLFGLLPACVMPFLIRRAGISRANYMTLMTQSFSASLACEWGLLHGCQDDSEDLLRRHLLRLRHVPQRGIVDHKAYLETLDEGALLSRLEPAVNVSRETFAKEPNRRAISSFLTHGEIKREY